MWKDTQTSTCVISPICNTHAQQRALFTSHLILKVKVQTSVEKIRVCQNKQLPNDCILINNNRISKKKNDCAITCEIRSQESTVIFYINFIIITSCCFFFFFVKKKNHIRIIWMEKKCHNNKKNNKSIYTNNYNINTQYKTIIIYNIYIYALNI